MKDKVRVTALIAIVIASLIGLCLTFVETASYVPALIGVILLLLGLILYIYDAYQTGNGDKWKIIFCLAYFLWFIGDFLKLPIPGYGFKIIRAIAGLLALILFIAIIVHDLKLRHQNN